MTSLLRSRRWRLFAVLATLLILAAGPADARAGRGSFSFGSRGARTFQPPAATPTAPRPAAPMQRSQVQPDQPAPNAVPGYQRPYPQAGRGGLFGGWGGGFLGGLLGAGLIGMLLGHGLFGGFGGLGSMLGFLLQIALIVFLVRWAVRAFQRRQQPAGAGFGLNRDAAPPYRGSPYRGAGPAAPGRATVRDELGIGPRDLSAFERLLGVIQTAYGREDTATLRANATPEMAGYLEEELAENAARGVLNHVQDPRLLQGDLAEAWREGGMEYATVAMRFALTDYTVERGSGRVVEGDPNQPVEATELWTFVRPRGGQWRLSAIQQS